MMDALNEIQPGGPSPTTTGLANNAAIPTPTTATVHAINTADQPTIEALEAQRQSLLAEVERLNQAKATAQAANVPTSATPISAIAHIPRTKQLAPRLSKFSGKREHYESWRMEAESKMLIDGPLLGDEQAQLGYLFASMEPEAQNAVKGIYKHVRQGQEPAQELLAYMDRKYIDPNARMNALQKLSTMRQGANESFQTWYPKFETALYDAESAGTPDEEKINYLRQALNLAMQTALVGPTLYASFTAYVSAAYLVDSQLTHLRALKQNLAPTQTAAAQWRSSPGLSPSTHFSGSRPVRSYASALTTDGRARWVDQDEIKRRRDANLCLRCAGVDHRIAECTTRPAIRPVGTTGQPIRARQAVVDVEEEEVPVVTGKV